MTNSTEVQKLVFAWTATDGYDHYPPYVNITGNRIAVRGDESMGADGYMVAGTYVAIDLPDEVIAELRAALAAITEPEA